MCHNDVLGKDYVFFSGKEKLPINDDDDVGVNVTLCCKEEPNNHG